MGSDDQELCQEKPPAGSGPGARGGTLDTISRVVGIVAVVMGIIGGVVGLIQWREQIELNRTKAASELILKVADRQFMDAYVRLVHLRHHAQLNSLTYEVAKDFYGDCTLQNWNRCILSDLNLVVSAYHLASILHKFDLLNKALAQEALSSDFRVFCEVMDAFSRQYPELSKNEKLGYLRQAWGATPSGSMFH